MLTRSLLLALFLFVSTACSPNTNNSSTPASMSAISEEIYYSKAFSDRYKIKKGKRVDEWNELLAVVMQRQPADGYNSCSLKIYLGKDINFDYPKKENFINIMGDRYDEIFSYVEDVTDEDARLHAQQAFQSANLIAIEGFKGEKSTAIAGLNIDYVKNDVAVAMSYIKTLGVPCNALETKEYNYYLRLKPKGIDKSADFLKFKLPLNK